MSVSKHTLPTARRLAPETAARWRRSHRMSVDAGRLLEVGLQLNPVVDGPLQPLGVLLHGSR
jgi:hypothetical protein